jgi:LPS export ABC transporter protein LptC
MTINKRFITIFLFFTLLGSNNFAKEEQQQDEDMPLIETIDMEVLYSEEGIVVAKMTTAKRLQYENGDSIYPLGIYVECYDKEKKLTATLRANTVYQYADEDIWELKGDVEIKGYQEGKQRQLNTEELYWDLKNKQIYTSKFVRFETENELLTGYGFNSRQDLTYYTITAPQGFVNVDATEIE